MEKDNGILKLKCLFKRKNGYELLRVWKVENLKMNIRKSYYSPKSRKRMSL